MATALYRLGAACARRAVLVIVVWLLALVAVGAAAAGLRGTTVNTFDIPGLESTQALGRLQDTFPGAGSTTATARVVFEVPAGQAVTDPQRAAAVAATVQRLTGADGVTAASDPFDATAPTVSPDRRAAFSTVTYAVSAQDVSEDQRQAVLDVVAGARTDGLTVEASGDALTAPTEVGGIGEVIGVVAALVVLAITYGTLVTAGMNLLTALVGVGIGAAGVSALTGFVELQDTTPLLALMLGLAVGIDYALFLLSRVRQELAGGREARDAVATATGTAGSAVVTAGITVVIALAGLSVVGIPFLTQMGLAAAATVVIAVLVAVTLLPAVATLLGRRVLSRRDRAADATRSPGAGSRTRAHAARHAVRRGGFVAGWGRAVTEHRWLSLVLGVVGLAVIAIPVADLQTSLPDDGTAAPATTQRKAYDIIGARFGPGVNGPLVVLVTGPDAVRQATAVTPQITALPDVAAVLPAQPSPDGQSALVTVIPRSGPTTPATTDLVSDLRDTYARDLDGPVRAAVTGQTAVNVDVSAKLAEALPVYLAVVVGLALVLLVLVFRSVLVPVTAVLGFLLTIGAALGATTAVFQWGWLRQLVNSDVTGPLLSLTPVIVVGVLFGLAMDYQVFLVSRIHEAHAHGESPRDAVLAGFRRAAPVVSAAAVIMFAVFAGFVPEGDATLKPIAFTLAVGILFDAFVVRMLIVPAVLSVLGEAAWWLPRWLRWLPSVDVEGTALASRRAAIA